MKKTSILFLILTAAGLSAQFTVKVQAPENFAAKEAIIYTLNGSKDIIASKEIKKNNSWLFTFPKSYTGMLKIYFPENNNSISLISENKDAVLTLETDGKKIKEVVYSDASNKLMDEVQENQLKKESILPALKQIKEYYKSGSEFGTALDKEIGVIAASGIIDPAKHPFINYYNKNYNKYLGKNAGQKEPMQEEIISFLSNSTDLLETSSLVRPLLVAYLNSGSNTNVDGSVDRLLTAINVETPRGQMVLSELIDIFDVYEMASLKDKYLLKAKNLKCTITDRLANTIKVNKNVEMGAKFPDYSFTNATNTKAGSLYDVKAKQKIIIFWSSTCSHCEAEIPKLLEKYNQLKASNVEVIGLSLDTEKDAYDKKVSALPWVNTTELKGWNSSFAETYNIHATPTYFILDENNTIIDKPEHVGDVLEFFKLK
ncbi:TlpA family protein disulfide reductase [Chryseobacterium sp.]|uniref:TlpA family protein disulfide reductase n=1 Tax=Chryseobacterium sp. TaxID=1871047 RepID=UPI0011CC755D|nr:TlpA disulfide reductase family protein [Chryseobacterium sp.]TXF76379.1 redoxin domain-containing protein [Chryseobacterium sp.]